MAGEPRSEARCSAADAKARAGLMALPRLEGWRAKLATPAVRAGPQGAHACPAEPAAVGVRAGLQGRPGGPAELAPPAVRAGLLGRHACPAEPAPLVLRAGLQTRPADPAELA